MFYLCSTNFFLVYFQAPSVLIIQLQICSSEFFTCAKKKERKVWAVTMRKLPATRTRGFHVEHWPTRSAAVYHREFRTSKQEVVSLRRNLCARAHVCVGGLRRSQCARAGRWHRHLLHLLPLQHRLQSHWRRRRLQVRNPLRFKSDSAQEINAAAHKKPN